MRLTLTLNPRRRPLRITAHHVADYPLDHLAQAVTQQLDNPPSADKRPAAGSQRVDDANA